MKYYYDGSIVLSIDELEEMVTQYYHIVGLTLKYVYIEKQYNNTQIFNRDMLQNDPLIFFSVKVQQTQYEYVGALELNIEDCEELIEKKLSFRKGTIVTLQGVHAKAPLDNIGTLRRNLLQKDNTFSFSIKFDSQS